MTIGCEYDCEWCKTKKQVTKENVLEFCIDLLHMKTYQYSDSIKHDIFPYYDRDHCEMRLQNIQDTIKYLKENLK